MPLTNSEFLYLYYCNELSKIENQHSIFYYRNKFNELILHTQIHMAIPIREIYRDTDSIFFEAIPLLTNKT